MERWLRKYKNFKIMRAMASTLASLLSWVMCFAIFHENCAAVQCVYQLFPQPTITFPDLFGSYCCSKPELLVFSVELSMILVPGLLVFLLFPYAFKK